MWSAKFCAFATTKDFDELLNRTEKVPNFKPDECNKTAMEEYKSVTKTNMFEYSYLIQACEDDVSFEIARGSKTEPLPKNDVGLAWKILNLRYEPDNGDTMVKSKSILTTTS